MNNNRTFEGINVSNFAITVIVSFITGALVTIDFASNISSALVPLYATGIITRDTMILHASPTIVSLIMAAEMISIMNNIKLNEQKFFSQIIRTILFFNTFFILCSISMSIIGGYVLGMATGLEMEYYFFGITYQFTIVDVLHSFLKSGIFALIIALFSIYPDYKSKSDPQWDLILPQFLLTILLNNYYF